MYPIEALSISTNLWIKSINLRLSKSCLWILLTMLGHRSAGCSWCLCCFYAWQCEKLPTRSEVALSWLGGHKKWINMNGALFSLDVMIQNRSPIVPTFEEQPFSTIPQDHLKVSLFFEIAYLLALLLHFLGGLEGFLKFLLAQEVNHSHLATSNGCMCARHGDWPLSNPHLDASEAPKVSQPVLSGPWIRCLSLHAGSALLVGGLPTYLGSRTS